MAEPLALSDQLPLIRLLADGAWHPGPRLASALGISRAAVAKRMEGLVGLGLSVERQHGRGYRLSAPLEFLAPERIETPAGLRLRCVSSTGSTNSDLLAADPKDDPQALFAEYQSGGRGRRGRAWLAPFGQHLLGSLAWTFPRWPRDLGALPLAIGVATAEALAEAGVADVQLKWPNDLYARDAKLGGLLMEHRGELDGAARVVIGLGLNVRAALPDAPPGGVPPIAADTLAGRRTSRNALLGAVLRHWHALLRDYAVSGFAAWRARWLARDALRDRVITVLAEVPYQGIARGIDEDGALLVQRPDGGCIRLHGGDVSLRLA